MTPEILERIAFALEALAKMKYLELFNALEKHDKGGTAALEALLNAYLDTLEEA